MKRQQFVCTKGVFMEIRHIQCFLAVARYKNFRKASEAVYLSQPSISRSIKELEEELGCPLFIRTTNVVRLTDAGERILPVYYPSNRSLKALIINTVRAIRYLKKEKPDLIVSAGAAPAVPFFYIGKLMGAKTIFIEAYDRIDKASLTGKLCYRVSDVFIVQWEPMLKVFPKAVYLGSIF